MDRIPACRQAGKFPNCVLTIMVSVYAIISEVNGYIYVGMSSDLEKRLKEHNSGKSIYTKRFLPWSLLYAEMLPDRDSARKREKYLKSGIGKEFLKSLVP